MSDGVDPSIQRMQAPGSNGTVDRPGLEANLQQLTACHNTVLGLGETRNRLILVVRSQFTPHTGVKYDLGDSLSRPRTRPAGRACYLGEPLEV